MSLLNPNAKALQPSELSAQYLRKDVHESLQQGAQDIADIEEFLIPLPLGGKAARAAKKSVKPKVRSDAIQRMYNERSKLPPLARTGGIPETFESGLTKPRAVGAENPSLGLITKDRQTKTISKLDEEAKKLIESGIEKHVPISKRIKEGFDFGSDYEQRFGKLKATAEKANPEIETAPMSEFFSKTREKYRGIPSPHPDAKSVLTEMKSFRRNMPGDLNDLLKIYRSNNQKLKSIYETRLLKGKRAEYADFLTGMNRKIAESIENTLPADSAWVKEFKGLNKEFGEFKAAQDTLHTLEPLLKEKLSTSTLTRLAEDPGKQKYLRLKMGQKGADEIIKIAKDLKTARDAIKKIPVKELNKFEALWPVSWMFKPLGALTTGKKGLDYARRGWGYYLSKPNTRVAVDDALKAVSKRDLIAYEAAAKQLIGPDEVKLLEYKTKSHPKNKSSVK